MKKIIYIYLISFISIAYSKSSSNYQIENNPILNINTNYNSDTQRLSSSSQSLSRIKK